MNIASILRSAAVAVTALLVSSVALASGPANNPTKAQQKYLAADMRKDAHNESFYKNGEKPRHSTITFSRAINPNTGKRNGAPVATQVVSVGHGFYNPKQGNPVAIRDYKILRAKSGRLYSRPLTPWRPMYTLEKAAK